MTLAQSATRALGGDWHGSYGCAPTPGHGPKDRGLTIKDNDAGDDVLVNSFNGGDWREVKDTLRASGVLPAKSASIDRDRETGCYEYADETGTVLYRTKRIERTGKAKRFLAEYLKGDRWLSGMGDVRRILYRLPDIIAAPDAIVYLVEGERKADKLASWGLVATAIAFGAKGWAEKHEYAEHLRGRTVVILPDNDQPGREYADRVRTSINRVGKAIILELPGLPPKGDIMDWSGDVDELRTLTAAALNPPVEMLHTIDPASWSRMETPTREWSLHEWIPARQATYLTGPGSAGKSLISQQLCTCIAAGIPFMGIETKQSVAIYVTCEDDADELHRRQKAICASLGVTLESLSGKLLLVSLTGEIDNALATFDNDGRMTIGAGYRRLAATSEAHKAGFIALDNVAHLFAGNENIRNQVAAFCGLLNKLGQDADASVLFLGHPNKAGSEFSGSTAWENQVRSRLFIETPKDDDGTVPDRDARILSRGKANYARNGEGVTFRWHQWAFVRDEDLPAGVSEQLSASIQIAGENDRFLKCLDKSIEERRAVSGSSAAANYAPRVFAKMPMANGMKVAAFEGALQRLFHLGQITGDQPLYQRANRSWAKGLGRADESAQSVAQSLHKAAHIPCTEPHTSVHKAAHAPDPSTTYIKGAPALGGAPLEEQKPSTSRVCFPMTDAEAFEAEAWRDD